MTIEPGIIIAAFGVMGAAIVALYGVVIAEHRRCQTERSEALRMVHLLTEHTIAQQHDIDRMVQDRAKRGLERIALKSQKTDFYKTNILGAEI